MDFSVIKKNINNKAGKFQLYIGNGLDSFIDHVSHGGYWILFYF